jgi:hypothetical protein
LLRVFGVQLRILLLVVVKILWNDCVAPQPYLKNDDFLNLEWLANFEHVVQSLSKAHASSWCPFLLDPQLTTHHSNKGACFRAVTELGLHNMIWLCGASLCLANSDPPYLMLPLEIPPYLRRLLTSPSAYWKEPLANGLPYFPTLVVDCPNHVSRVEFKVLPARSR